jgi:hypothetical protein
MQQEIQKEEDSKDLLIENNNRNNQSQYVWQLINVHLFYIHYLLIELELYDFYQQIFDNQIHLQNHNECNTMQRLQIYQQFFIKPRKAHLF